MSDSVIEGVIAQLDALPRADPWVQLDDEGADLAISGNSDGLVRLARLLLQCSLDTPMAREYRSCGSVREEFRTIAWPGSSILLANVHLLQARPAAPALERRTTGDRLALLGCGVLASAVLFVFLMGLGVVTGVIPIAKR